MILLRKIKEFLEDESGQTSTEYILLVAVVAMIVFKFKGIATEKLSAISNGIFDKASNMVDNEMQ